MILRYLLLLVIFFAPAAFATPKVNVSVFEGTRIDLIDEECQAQGDNVRVVGAGKGRIERGQHFGVVAKMSNGSEILTRLVFTPYDGLGGDIIKYIEDACQKTEP